MSDDREFVEGYAASHGLRVEWEGEIGFGRECVGLLDGTRDSYIAYTYGCAAPDSVDDAYHKDTFIAVLGRGEDAERQLAEWVRRLVTVGAQFERREKDIPDLGSLMCGWNDELTAVVATITGHREAVASESDPA